MVSAHQFRKQRGSEREEEEDVEALTLFLSLSTARPLSSHVNISFCALLLTFLSPLEDHQKVHRSSELWSHSLTSDHCSAYTVFVPEEKEAQNSKS